LEKSTFVQFPFDQLLLPVNGIYFFYEDRETWGHAGPKPRVVRVGIYRDGNFRNRLADHYMLEQRRMNFDNTKPAPKDRSVFRKNIGRALLNEDKDSYLKTWEIDFTVKKLMVASGMWIRKN
jgi:hypothetical protein